MGQKRPGFNAIAAARAFILLSAFYCGLLSGTAQAQEEGDDTLAALLATPAFQERLEAEAPAPTGDLLTDRYFQEICQRNAAAAFLLAESCPAGKLEVLPDDLLASWQSEFGADPRYWQLRYYCAQQQQWGNAESYSGPDPLSLLEEGYKLGVFDEAGLTAIYYEKFTLAREQPDTGVLRGKPALKSQAVPELRGLLDQLVELYPDNARSWYERALLNFVLGDSDPGFADLQTGNLAKENFVRLPYPQMLGWEAANAAKPAGNKYISGALLFDGPHDATTTIVMTKAIHEQFKQLADHYDPLKVQLLSDFSVRFIAPQGRSSFAARALSSNSSWLAGDLLVRKPEQFSVEQRKSLLDFARRLWSVTEDSREIFDAEWEIEDQWPAYVMGDLLDMEYSDIPALLMKKLTDSETFSKDWLARDFGWGIYSMAWDGTLAAEGELRAEYEENLNKRLGRWRWDSLSWYQTPEELAELERWNKLGDAIEGKSWEESLEELRKMQLEREQDNAP